MKNIIEKFEKILENYEIDLKCNGTMTIDSICHLFPSEIKVILDYIKERDVSIISRISSQYFETFKDELLWMLEDAYKFGSATPEELTLLEKMLERVRGKEKVDLSEYPSFTKHRDDFYNKKYEELSK